MLINYLGGSQHAGSKLKEAGNTHWLDDNKTATNESGFTALPGGLRLNDFEICEVLNELTYFWSSTEGSVYWQAWALGMDTYGSDVAWEEHNIDDMGFSVRCIED